MLIRLIKFILVSILSLFYIPLNWIFLKIQGPYRRWYKEDLVSFIIATPLYYLFFVIVAILSIPLEKLGEELAPPVKDFR